MPFEDIKKFTLRLLEKLSVKDLVGAVQTLMNKIDEQESLLKQQNEEIQKHRDSISRLKGEKGKPKIKANKNINNEQNKYNDNNDNNDNNDDLSPPNNGNMRGRGKGKKNKKKTLSIDRQKRQSMDKTSLPDDAVFKGLRSIIIPDIIINRDNVEFIIEEYYSPSLKKTFHSKLPPEYQGYPSAGPGARSLLLFLHNKGRITHGNLRAMLKDFGINLSKGQISNIINQKQDLFYDEKEAARQAGVEKNSYQQTDDTGARCNGQNMFTNVTCNNDFTSFVTLYNKNRLSFIQAIAGGASLKFVIDENAISYFIKKNKSNKLCSNLKGFLNPNLVYSEEEFDECIIDSSLFSNCNDFVKRYIREGAAISAYNRGFLGPVSKILICDDAGQFKEVTKHLGLCWVHEYRHYKKLEPSSLIFIDILNEFKIEFKEYYKQLKLYKKNPTDELKTLLSDEFDKLFFQKSGYYALDALQAKTLKKKKSLLTVLEYPEIPLHNNLSEGDVREKVVQRKIRNTHRSMLGVKSSDTHLSLMATCRKQSISYFQYLQDRIYKRGLIPSLSEIIRNNLSPPFIPIM